MKIQKWYAQQDLWSQTDSMQTVHRHQMTIIEIEV